VERPPSVLDSTFVARLIPGRRVAVREGQVVWSFEVTPAGSEGWALLRPVSYGRALVVGAPSAEQVRRYWEAADLDTPETAIPGVCVGSAYESIAHESWLDCLPDEICRDLMGVPGRRGR
jgi:hypothetical protein